MFDVNEYDDYGICIREEVLPVGWVEVASYTPGMIPWDVDGRKWADRYRKVLKNANLHPAVLFTRRTAIAVRGTGPGGAVRLGDNMLPGIYRLAVLSSEESAALDAIVDHKASVEAWLNEGGPIPAVYDN